MILLKDIIRQARSGELRSLSKKDKTDEVIVDYINLGLLEIYKRFQLETEEAIITMHTAKTLYRIDGTDSDVTIKSWNGATFNTITIPEDDVLQITEAFDENGRVPINDDGDLLSVFTPSYDTIQVPITEDGSYISLIYKKNPQLVEVSDLVIDADGSLDLNDATTNTYKVKLPKTLLVPLLHYIGYRAHGAVEGEVNAENSTHLNRFEAACKRAEDLGAVPTDSTNRDVSVKGFI